MKNTKIKFILIMALLAVSALLVACTAEVVDESNGEDALGIGTDTVPLQQPLDDAISLSEKCEELNGTWIEGAEECEYISKGSCEALGGKFQECASACRNDPDAMVCTMQCVIVCEFADEHTDLEPVIEEFLIGPELQDCVGVGPQTCMIVNDEYFYDSIVGFEYEEGYNYELRVELIDRENPPADASSVIYTLVNLVSKTPAIPNNCTSWFDGCNNCMVVNGTLGGCTRMACSEEMMQEPECLQFE